MGSKVQGSKVVGSHHKVDQQYITNAEFQDVYDHAGRTRAAIRGFIPPYVWRAALRARSTEKR